MKLHELDKLLVMDKNNNLRTQSMCKKHAVFALLHVSAVGRCLQRAAPTACVI